MEKSKVYYSKNFSADKILELYQCLQIDLKGKVAVKVHSGEPGGKNFLKPKEIKKIVDYLNGTIVECNTAYEGRRYETADHLKTMTEHGFDEIAEVDIMDSEGPDLVLNIEPHLQISKNFVGKHLQNYDSMLVLSHFKGHAMGGFGGALKNMSIGIASKYGKAYIHGASEVEHLWDCEQDKFLESMADADKSIMDFFGKNIAFINCAVRLSVDCDCDSQPHDPKMADIGVLASLDPVALDQACIDLVYNSPDEEKADLIERIESLHGIHTIEAAASLGVGSREYELIDIDK